jgi:sulfur carrier protein
MNVTLNGERVELDERATAADAVAAAGVALPGRGVAVAVEGEVVPRAEWEQRGLREGEVVEVVHAVQGG